MSNSIETTSNINDKLKKLEHIKINTTNQIIIESDEIAKFIVYDNFIPKYLNLNEDDTLIMSNLGIFKNIYSITSDINTRKFKIFNSLNFKPELNFHFFTLGIESNKCNLTDKLLKSKEKNIVIILNNLKDLDEDLYSCIKDISHNINLCLKSYKKHSITIILFKKSSEEVKSTSNNNIIKMNNFNPEEIYNLAVKNKEFEDLSYDDFIKAYQLNYGNCDNTFFTLRLFKNEKYVLDEESIDNLINKLIDKINLEIKFKDIDNGTVLKLFSVFPTLFDPYEIAKLDSRINESELDENIKILEHLLVLKRENENSKYYSMIKTLKDSILNKNKRNKKDIFNIYYKYLTRYFPLEFQRKIDLQNNYLHDSDEIIYQYLLQYEYYYTNNMNESIDEMIARIDSNYDIENLRRMFEDISNFDHSGDSECFYDKYICNNNKINAFWLKKDIEYYSTLNSDYKKLKNLCDTLYDIIIKEKDFEDDPLYKAIYLITLIPQYIDKYNDIDKTNILLNEVKNLDKQLCSQETHDNIELYKNILNRKSYLLKDILSAISDCKLSLKYFEDNNSLQELYMTLNTLMCLELANDNIRSAIEYKNRISELKLPKNIKENFQYYKSEMNFILLDFFDGTIDKKSAVKKYEEIFNNKNILLSKTSKNILCLNICALSLENNDIDTYKKYKKIFEKENEVDEVVDFENNLVDDFYLYHFAWFEFGLNIMESNIENAKFIYNKLNSLVPTIYRKENEILNKKYILYKDIFTCKSLTGEEFSNYIFHKKTNIREARFFFRGFMLSDIHHTSIL